MSRAARADISAGAILDRLARLHPKKIDLSLGRIHGLLARLGNPERKLPPTIHVAGTNGKGSTIAIMRAVLEAANFRVHAYTSPSLVRFHERIRLGRPGGGLLVDDATLATALAECERLNGNDPITFFEITTAAAFSIFAAKPADFLLLETGLGGRLDATNVIEHPIASVITSVSIDHTEYLGPTLAAIAGEKAGILKRGVPAIVAHQEPEALAVIERAAAKLASPLFVAGEQWAAHEERSRLIYADESSLLDLPRPRLFGRHQIENAGIAVAALRAIKSLQIPAEAYEDGMRRVEWPARMQQLSSGRLIGRLPAGSELWLDGGHNVGGAMAIAGALTELEERTPRPLILVAGMLATKDTDGFLTCFSGLARRLFALPVIGDNTRKPDEIVAAAVRAGIAAETATSIEDALEKIAALPLEAPPRVLITGSLYLAGEILAANGTPPV
ncbi:MAG TPA: folylpolyglutamate synthase/dihydrofolate synthase family protein [Xanthobacteraceae bacterium]|nr:folylpolyglutamate synthase/dihydrofolate synthase family protein [Xanthobacteraceae bacterium]